MPLSVAGEFSKSGFCRSRVALRRSGSVPPTPAPRLGCGGAGRLGNRHGGGEQAANRGGGCEHVPAEQGVRGPLHLHCLRTWAAGGPAGADKLVEGSGVCAAPELLRQHRRCGAAPVASGNTYVRRFPYSPAAGAMSIPPGDLRPYGHCVECQHAAEGIQPDRGVPARNGFSRHRRCRRRRLARLVFSLLVQE